MAICLDCGAIHHNEDKHICKPEEVPLKGKERAHGSEIMRDVKK